MRLIPALAAISITLSGASAPARHYRIESASSEVRATVPFFGIASKTARFPDVSGGASLAGNSPESLAIDVALDARTLQAGDAVTRGRLRGERFFWVDRYPTVRFMGQGMTMEGEKNGRIAGQLTARGVTRPVVLEVSFAKPVRSVSPDEPLTLEASTRIDRRDFGMTAYPLIVGRKVVISIRTRMVRD